MLLIYKLGIAVSNDRRVGLLCLWCLALVTMFALWTMGGLETPLYRERVGFCWGFLMLFVSFARNDGAIYFIV
ncbi:MAG: hypothetical protein ACUVWP_04620 [bacterium]